MTLSAKQVIEKAKQRDNAVAWALAYRDALYSSGEWNKVTRAQGRMLTQLLEALGYEEGELALDARRAGAVVGGDRVGSP